MNLFKLKNHLSFFLMNGLPKKLYMKRACQILTHKRMTNSEQHVSPIKIKI